MREDILNWDRKKNEKHWDMFLKFFETGPVTDEEFSYILKKEKENGAENLIRHAESNFNPVRVYLNSIYNKDKFSGGDLTKVDDNFINGEKVNLKLFLRRITQYPMSLETFERLLASENTTGAYNPYKQNHIKVSKAVLIIANRLHSQNKLGFDKTYFSSEEVVSELEQEVLKALKENPATRKERLRHAPKKPEKIRIVTTGYRRNPDVIAETLLRAKGVCEQCNISAPFIRKKDNTPYLEVHHKVMLSDGGDDTIENTIALCPNCHRERHYAV